jgi:hypothetical protein
MASLVAVLIGFLAVGGVIAIVLRLLGALLGLGLTAAEASAASSLAEASARRGDLTGMMERKQASVALRRRRIRAAGWVSLWLGLLVVPPILDLALPVYAVAAGLWLIPRPKLRPPAQDL